MADEAAHEYVEAQAQQSASPHAIGRASTALSDRVRSHSPSPLLLSPSNSLSLTSSSQPAVSSPASPFAMLARPRRRPVTVSSPSERNVRDKMGLPNPLHFNPERRQSARFRKATRVIYTTMVAKDRDRVCSSSQRACVSVCAPHHLLALFPSLHFVVRLNRYLISCMMSFMVDAQVGQTSKKDYQRPKEHRVAFATLT